MSKETEKTNKEEIVLSDKPLLWLNERKESLERHIYRINAWSATTEQVKQDGRHMTALTFINAEIKRRKKEQC